MKRVILLVFLLLPFGFAKAGTDGELAWESVTFCDGAQFCVRAKSSDGTRISSLEIDHKGNPILIPPSMYKDVKNPLFNEMRLLVTRRPDGKYENVLEVPFFEMKGDSPERSVIRIHISNDEAYRSEIVE